MLPRLWTNSPSAQSTLGRKCRRLLMLSWICLAVTATAALAAVPTPSVSVPPAGMKGFPFLRGVGLAAAQYTEAEYLISGQAQAFANVGTLGNDGVWTVAPDATAPYTTRLLVRTPADPQRFNGTVVVEWLNVSGGVDSDAEWAFEHVELLRSGFAWVGVTTQAAGADFLPTFDPERYASIFHPGDSFSYDMFSQAGMAIINGNPRPLGQLTPQVRAVLAIGESQSAFRLLTYYDAIHPEAQVYQGFLIHSAGSGAALSQSIAAVGVLGGANIPTPPGVPATPDITVPAAAFIRSDLAQPVLFVNTETDVQVLGAGFSVHNQPDSDTFRMWELAGTTHADAYLLAHAAEDAANSGLVATPFVCGDPPINNGPETFSLRMAVHALAQWVLAPQQKPSIGPRLSMQIVTSPAPSAVINRDPATGNALGGIRLPQVAVPIETLTGIRPPAAIQANVFCILFGSASPWDGGADSFDGVPGIDPAPFPAPSLAALYGTQANYIFLFRAATFQSVLEGFMLPGDMLEEFETAFAANVPKGSLSNASIIPDP